MTPARQHPLHTPQADPRSTVTDQTTATEATELDKTRRYLRPVRATTISGDPDGVHLALYEWLPMFEEWATGPGICGESLMQGPLPEGTAVTCAACLEWRPKYERMLAPGYRPEDDDPDVLRRRAEAAERQVLQAKALVAKWRQVAAERDDAVVVVGVAADILLATLDGFNDLLAETPQPGTAPVPPEYVRLKGQLESDLSTMTACAAQEPKEGVEGGRIAQGGIAAGIRSSLAWAIHCFEGSGAREAFLKRLEGGQ